MKTPAPEDPLELVGVGVPEGDADYMAECLIEEYVLMGWNDRQLMSLFTRPFFRMTRQIYLDKGEDYVRSLIGRVRARWTPSVT